MRHLSSAFLFFLVALLPLTGCKCGKGAEDPTIQITSPLDGAVISQDDDVDPGRVGIQIAVSAVAENVQDGSGTSVIVNEDANLAVPGFVVGNAIAFPTVTVIGRRADGTALITVSVRDRETEKTATASVTITVESPNTLDCAFVSPLADATLGEADDADPATRGFQFDVVIQCGEDLTGTPANLSIDGLGVASAVFAGASATFSRVTFNEGANLVTGSVSTAAGSWSDQVRVIVDTPSCEVRLAPDGAVVFNLDGDTPRFAGYRAIADEDGDDTNGVQATLTATTPDCQGGQAVLQVEGADLATVDVTGTSVDFGAVTLPDGPAIRAQVEVRPGGATGPSGLSAPQDYFVDSGRPSPAITFPGSGIVLGNSADKDGDPSNGVQVDVTIEAPGLEVTSDPNLPELSSVIDLLVTHPDSGSTTTISCVVGVDGCLDPTTADRYLLEATLDLDGAWTLEVAVTDPAGNVGVDGPVGFLVSTGGGNVLISAPVDGSTVNRASAGVSDTSIPLDVSAPTLPAGTQISVVCTGAAGTGTGTLGAAGTARIDLGFTGLPCEGAVAVCTPSADVGGTVITGPPVSFTVDLSPPGITIAAPTDGATIFDTNVPVEVVTTCLEDGQAVNVTADTGASASGSAASDSAIVGLTLASGAHVLSAATADAAGNSVTSGTVTVTIDADPPQVVFVQPSDGLFLTGGDDVDTGSPGFQYDVTIQVPNKPAGAAVILQVGFLDGTSTVFRAPIGPVATNASFRSVFSAVDLPEGASSLKAIATSVSGLTGERTIGLTVGTGGVACNVVEPVDGASLGAPHDQNGNLADGVQTDVRVRTTAADGATVDLTVTDPAGASSTVSGTASGGQVTFAGVSFVADGGGNHGLNLLEAVCDVGGASPTDALSSAIEVDLEAPTVTILEPLDGTVFNLSSADGSAAAGFQTLFRATASDASTGTSVKAGASGILGIDCTSGSSASHAVSFGVFGAQVEAQARPTLDDGSDCTLSFTAIDQAGNTSAPVSVIVTIDRQAPTVAFPGLTTGQIFNAGGDASGAAGFQRNVRVSFGGVETTGSVALLVSNTFGDTGAAGWNRQSAEGSPISPAAAAVDHVFSGATLTLGDADTITLAAVATDAAGNSSEANVTVSVDLVAPVVTITRPDPSNLPSCFNVFNDTNGSTPGLQIQVDVGTVGVEDGLPLSLCTSVDPGTGLGNCLGNPSNFIVGESTVSGNIAVFLPATFMDGVQDVEAEVRDRAGNFSTSGAFQICVDTTPPDVTSLTVGTDTMAPAGTVNALEYSAAGNQICFTVNATDADGQQARIETNNPSAGTLVGTGLVSSGTATICGALAQGGHAITAKVFDAAGNPNISANPPLVDPQAVTTLIVDTVAPTLSIASPAGTVLNGAGDAIPGTADYDFDYGVSSDAGDGRTVDFLVDGGSVGTAALAAGTATLAGETLGQGSHLLRVDVTDAAGNAAFAERTVMVDTLAPTVAILSPSDGANLNTADVDFQVQVTGAATGDLLEFVDTISTGTLASRTVAAGQPQTEMISLSDAAYDVVARATDAAGNVGSSTTVQVTVDTLGCSIRWIDPANASVTFLASDDEQTGTAGLQTTVTATTSDCQGRDIELWVSGSLVTTVASDGTSGNASFTLDLADGASGIPVMARIVDAASNATTSTFTAAADVTPPGLSRTSPTGAGVTYVSATNSHLAAGTWAGTTVIADKVAGGALQADFSYSVTGAIGGTFALRFGGSNLLAPVSITTSPQTVNLTDVVIAQGSLGDLTGRVTDAAGNQTDDVVPITVDVQAPAVPTVAPTLTNNRAATVGLSWADTGDDASTGTATAYDLRWSTADIANETDFEAANAFTVGFAPGASGGGQTLSLTPLPPINTYWIALRIEDEVGNRSALTNVVSQANPWTTTTLTGEGGNFPWQVVPAGDINNDGQPDFVATAVTMSISGASAAGAAYVYYGGAAYSQADSRRQRLATGTAGDLFGMHAQAADVSADGIPDLIVGASGHGANRGRVRIYFGQDRSAVDCSGDFTLCWLDPADFVDLKGDSSMSGQFGKMVGAPADFKQLGSTLVDGAAEVVVGAPAAASSRGRVYVYASRSKAAWQAARTATDDAGVTFYIPVAGAEFVIEGAAVNDALGYRWGVVGLGDLDGDNAEELGLSSSLIATEYIYDGATLAAATGTISAASGTLSTLTGTTTGNDYALGVRAVSAFVSSGATPELIVAVPAQAQIRMYATNSTGAGALLTTLRSPLSGVLPNLGFDLATGDLNLDGRPDLVAGSNNVGTPSGVVVYYNSGTGTFYATRPDTKLISLATGLNGVAVEIGDYNGSLRDDLVVGDITAGSLIVYHD